MEWRGQHSQREPRRRRRCQCNEQHDHFAAAGEMGLGDWQAASVTKHCHGEAGLLVRGRLRRRCEAGRVPSAVGDSATKPRIMTADGTDYALPRLVRSQRGSNQSTGESASNNSSAPSPDVLDPLSPVRLELS